MGADLPLWCSYCKQWVPLEDYWPDMSEPMCKSCHDKRNSSKSKKKWNSEYKKKRRANPNDSYREDERKRSMDYYHSVRQKQRDDFFNKFKVPCAACGEGRLSVICFHHVDPSTKEFNIGSSSLNKHSKDEIEKEINKCICLCENCHREFHHTYGYRYKDQEKALIIFLDDKREECFG